ncbi:MAG: 5-(carboxyamino)imidazole ribonucleotide synthase [Paraglaciecola sp.]|jgi:5-(carboxyamino)imidazole ribonucleotide synthase
MSVLILGSGQLARMMYLAGAPLGMDVQAVDVSDNKVVNPVTKEILNITLERAIEEAESISVEFEHIPEELLQLVHASGKLMPSVEAILAGADRVREKRLLEKLAIQNCPHQIITHIDQLDSALVELGERLIIKTSRDGYDGYGQWRLTQPSELKALKLKLAELDLNKVPLIAEKMLNFDRELSLIGVRSKKGDMVFYPLTENLHHKGQLHVSVAPAPHVSDALTQQAQLVSTKLAEELDYVGVLAVEFFQMGENLLVNEIAPRVHNSGHWTMQGADTCQFENHLRAITGLPLGDTRVTSHSAMINIIGFKAFSRDMLGIPGCHLHWYGKTPRKKRKMGHFNLSRTSYQELAEAMQALAEYLPPEHFPKLLSEATRLAEIKSDI